jgi:hypothetical protein
MAFKPNKLSQRDPQWKDDILGFDDACTIGTDGCALTCLAMLVNGFGFNETPKTLNKKLKDLGPGSGFIGPLMVWYGLTRIYPKVGFKTLVICKDQNAPLAAIDSALAAGQAVLVEVDRSLAQGLQTHWVVVYAKKDDDYLILDPFPYPSDDKDVTLTTRYGFGRELTKFITAVAFYECWVGGDVGGDGLYVKVLESVTTGLRLRSAPNAGASVLATAAAGTPLRVLEAEAAALAKIGVENQWLNVADPYGVTGYVAAWYVALMDGNISPIEPEEPENPEEPVEPEPADVLKVYVAPGVGASGLRLRSEPSTSSSTITIMNASAELTVLGDAEAAKAKIGAQGQWLRVRTASGQEGFTAAWLLVLSLGGTEEPEQPEEPETLDVIVLYSVGSNGLRLRSEPYGTILASEKAGTHLRVLESIAQAAQKIGVANQWLNVRDPQGRVGYVAAWYVMLDDSGGGEAPDTSLTVYVSQQASNGLRMRSQPNTSAPTTTVLKVNTALAVLEPTAEAEAKVGVTNQWLKVREPGGKEGYVAAWFVRK